MSTCIPRHSGYLLLITKHALMCLLWCSLIAHKDIIGVCVALCFHAKMCWFTSYPEKSSTRRIVGWKTDNPDTFICFSDAAGLQKSGGENPEELWRGDNRGHCQSGPRVSVSETVRWVSFSVWQSFISMPPPFRVFPFRRWFDMNCWSCRVMLGVINNMKKC